MKQQGNSAQVVEHYEKFLSFTHVMSFIQCLYAAGTFNREKDNNTYKYLKWLQNFVYRINLGIGQFLMAAVATLLLSLLPIGSQSVKAAMTNPGDSHRYE